VITSVMGIPLKVIEVLDEKNVLVEDTYTGERRSYPRASLRSDKNAREVAEAIYAAEKNSGATLFDQPQAGGELK